MGESLVINETTEVAPEEGIDILSPIGFVSPYNRNKLRYT
jgi:hypothetical protein